MSVRTVLRGLVIGWAVVPGAVLGWQVVIGALAAQGALDLLVWLVLPWLVVLAALVGALAALGPARGGGRER